MKKIISLVLMVAMLLTALPAMADNVRTSGVYTYKIKGNGTLTITDFNWDQHGYDNDVFIPIQIDGYSVTGIENEAFAVDKCSNQNTIELHIPNGIVTIGDFAFKNAHFSYVSIPASVQLIGKGAFANCRNLSKFYVDANNPVYATIDSVLFHKASKQLVAYPYAMYNEGKYDIPEGIQSIAPYAFYWELDEKGNGVYDISAIKWPTTLKEIGDYAFYGCSVSTIPLIEKIGSYSFAYADAWALAEKEDDFGRDYLVPYFEVNEIGDHSFHSFSSVGKNHLIITAKDIPSYAFYKVFRTIKLIDVEHIGEGAFQMCSGIYGIFPSSIKSIAAYAFADCNFYIDTIEIPGAVNEIGDFAFAFINEGRSHEENELETVIVQEGCTRIGVSAFEGQNCLREVIVPNTITEIGTNAFADCPKLDSIELPASISYIGDGAFDKAGITLYVEQGSYAALWASENGYAYIVNGQSDGADWLNN